MSTGADCRFYEEKPGQWFYKLQCYPYGETDDYDKFGPFGTYRKAVDHLDSHHANPGGWTTSALPGCKHDLIVLPKEQTGIFATVHCDRCGASWDLKEWQALQNGPDLDWEVIYGKFNGKDGFTYRTEVVQARTHRQAAERAHAQKLRREGEQLREIRQVPRPDTYSI